MSVTGLRSRNSSTFSSSVTAWAIAGRSRRRWGRHAGRTWCTRFRNDASGNEAPDGGTPSAHLSPTEKRRKLECPQRLEKVLVLWRERADVKIRHCDSIHAIGAEIAVEVDELRGIRGPQMNQVVAEVVVHDEVPVARLQECLKAADTVG